MRDFVRSYWKIAATSASAAFLLSLLVGLISRNPFGVMLLRALPLSMLFAGLGIGLRYVVLTYLPELVSRNVTAPASPGAGKPDGRGGLVDITLPEENPRGPQAHESGHDDTGEPSEGNLSPGLEGALGETEFADSGASGDASEASPEAADSSEGAEAFGELAEELAEELPTASEQPEAAAGGGEGEATTGRRAARGRAREQALSAKGSRKSTLESDAALDSLPDISTVEVTDTPSAGATRSRSARGNRGGTPEDALLSAVGGQDPATLAKAIRTVLKKDEKG